MFVDPAGKFTSGIFLLFDKKRKQKYNTNINIRRQGIMNIVLNAKFHIRYRVWE